MYDPTYPPTNAEIESAPLRGQFTGLKDLIDAISTITAAQIDSVTTGNPGDAASVGLSVVGNVLHFTFALPRGAQGPPFANAVVDSVINLPSSDVASVNSIFDGSTLHLTFGIPRGADGVNGTNGGNGLEGPPGPPGEVSNAALASAILGTSHNSNAVATLGSAANVDYDQTQMQEVINKLDELIYALRR